MKTIDVPMSFWPPDRDAMTYAIIRQAIIDRRSLTCSYDNCTRLFSPHILGRGPDGRVCVIAFQYAGRRPDGSAAHGEWCCLDVGRIDRLRANGDRWVAGPLGDRPLHRLREIEVKA